MLYKCLTWQVLRSASHMCSTSHPCPPVTTPLPGSLEALGPHRRPALPHPLAMYAQDATTSLSIFSAPDYITTSNTIHIVMTTITSACTFTYMNICTCCRYDNNHVPGVMGTNYHTCMYMYFHTAVEEDTCTCLYYILIANMYI